MSREIKFRALCRVDEGDKMMFFSEHTFDNGIWFTSLDHIDEYLSPIMQFTGVKDKNDFEIYEGDIIKSFRTGNRLYKVVFDQGRFTGKGIKTGFTLSLFDFISSEIIGNIHEHSHLLP